MTNDHINKVKQKRYWRPYSGMIFKDNLDGLLVTIQHAFLRTEAGKEALIYRKFNTGLDIVITIDKFNAMLEDGETLRFEVCKNPEVILEERNLVKESVVLLKEIADEISDEHFDLQLKIRKFIDTVYNDR